jgi:hypothetical protein
VLKGRLITATPPEPPSNVMPINFERVEEVLGMKVSDFHTTEQVRKTHLKELGSLMLILLADNS